MKKVFLSLVVMLFAVSVASAQMGASVQGGISLPMGTFGDGFDMGFGGAGTFMYTVAPNVALTGSAGYLMYSGKADGWDMSVIPVTVGARYCFPAGSVKPYASAEAGMFFSTVEWEIDMDSGDESGSDFGFAVGGGVVIPVSPTVGVDVSAKYNMIMTEGESTSSIGIMAGVNFAL